MALEHRDDRAAIAYPNPITDHINLEFESEHSQEVVIQLINRTGDFVFQNEYEVVAGSNTIHIPLNEAINDGLLLYRIQLWTQLLTGQVTKVDR